MITHRDGKTEKEGNKVMERRTMGLVWVTINLFYNTSKAWQIQVSYMSALSPRLVHSHVMAPGNKNTVSLMVPRVMWPVTLSNNWDKSISIAKCIKNNHLQFQGEKFGVIDTRH